MLQLIPVLTKGAGVSDAIASSTAVTDLSNLRSADVTRRTARQGVGQHHMTILAMQQRIRSGQPSPVMTAQPQAMEAGLFATQKMPTILYGEQACGNIKFHIPPGACKLQSSNDVVQDTHPCHHIE
jgi:hypothetical protein